MLCVDHLTFAEIMIFIIFKKGYILMSGPCGDGVVLKIGIVHIPIYSVSVVRAK